MGNRKRETERGVGIMGRTNEALADAHPGRRQSVNRLVGAATRAFSGQGIALFGVFDLLGLDQSVDKLAEGGGSDPTRFAYGTHRDGLFRVGKECQNFQFRRVRRYFLDR